MRQFVIFAFCSLTLVHFGSSCGSKNPGISDYETVENVAGGTASSAPIPYQLSLRFQSVGEWSHKCGAVILNETTAISAAHCFASSKNVERYRVHAGVKSLYVTKEGEQTLRIKKLLIHPNYNNIRSGSDIALLQVDRFQFNENVQGVWLSPFSSEKLANTKALISGWGKTSNEGDASNSLMKGNVTILSPQDCMARKQRQRAAVPGIVCALEKKTRTCRGDSGGPLVIQNYKHGHSTGNLLVGIVSFGAKNCDREDTPGFFTEISHFYNWITENQPTESDGGDWTVIQKRSPGTQEDFNLTLNEYVQGFGSLNGSFWIGLENIRNLAKNGDQELRIDLEDFQGEKAYAKYSSFSISAAKNFYQLSLSGFSGTAGDSMTNSETNVTNNGMKFSTRDKDNDLKSADTCAERNGGGWWFNACGNSNLNGPYREEEGENAPQAKGIFWYSWKEGEFLAKTEMKIRKRK